MYININIYGFQYSILYVAFVHHTMKCMNPKYTHLTIEGTCIKKNWCLYLPEVFNFDIIFLYCIFQNRQRGSEESSSPMESSSASPPQSNTSQQAREENSDVAMESDESQTPSQSQSQAEETSSQSQEPSQSNSQSQEPGQNNSQSQQPSQGAAGTSQNGTSQEQPRMV